MSTETLVSDNAEIKIRVCTRDSTRNQNLESDSEVVMNLLISEL